MNAVSEYIQGAKDELLNHVTWPTSKELVKSALIVLVASGLLSLLVFAMDELFGHFLLKSFYDLFS